MRPAFQNGDVVMVCHHIYEDATKGDLSIPWDEVLAEGPFDPGMPFNREDGTVGRCAFAVQCRKCLKTPGREVDYIEEFWLDGLLHVADFCKAHKVANEAAK